MIARRDFIKNLSMAISATALYPSFLWSQEHVENHILLAKKIKKKFSGKELTLLYPKGSLANLQPVAERFFEYTKVKINLKEGSLDTISSEIILKSHLKGAGSDIDIGLPATFAMPDLIESKSIIDLSDFSNEYEPQNFRSNWLYTLGDFYKGKLYGYQADGDTYLMFYRKSYFESPNYKNRYEERFEVELKVPSTWSELDQQITFFHSPRENRFGGNLYRNASYTIWEFWMRLHANGVYPVTDEFAPQLTSKQSIDALRELIRVSKALDPKVYQDGLFENFQNFSKGNSFCNLGWGGTQKYLNGPNSKIKDDLIVALPPGNTINNSAFRTPYFNWGWNYVVSSRSVNQELAFLFCLFSSTKKISSLAVQQSGGYFDPFIEEHYQSNKVKDIYGSQFLEVHKTALKQSIPDFYVEGQGLYSASLKEGISAALAGNLSPEIALESVSRKWNRITESIGRESQVEQWRYLKKSYPDSISKALS